MKIKVNGKFSREHALYNVGDILSVNVETFGKQHFVMFRNNSNKIVYSFNKKYSDKKQATQSMKKFIDNSYVDIVE